MSTPDDKSIEYIYAAHSAYAYLGSKRLMAIAEKTGRRIEHRPVDLREVVAHTGTKPIRERGDAHINYFFGREIDRWAHWRNAPVLGHRPTHHSNGIERSNCTLIAAMQAGHDIDQLAHVFLEAHWRDDADLDDEPTLVRLTDSLGLPGAELVKASHGEAALADYRRYTDDAVARGVFGSPTYVVDGDMFYGQDRLEMVEHACEQPFPG